MRAPAKIEERGEERGKDEIPSDSLACSARIGRNSLTKLLTKPLTDRLASNVEAGSMTGKAMPPTPAAVLCLSRCHFLSNIMI